MSTMTAAQLAQQHNRSTDGRYVEQVRAETDLDLGGEPERCSRDELQAQLQSANAAYQAALEASRTIAGQLLLRGLRDRDERVVRAQISDNYGDYYSVTAFDADGHPIDLDLDTDDLWDVMADAYTSETADVTYDPGFNPKEMR